MLRTGITWRALPHDFPPWQTVYSYWRSLKLAGVWVYLNDILRQQVRQQDGRESEASLLIADSQSVKTTEKGGHAASTEAS
ncbi:MAG: transposase, IS4 family protein [Chloroflexi bacterium OLB13]|nr:MAG: transposase, IS4 family protein [Chloroflexi bacterium OLB13]